ncbi:hypothetical protein FALBO_12238 [Fusarium albosuccineum]|uniref:Uncharacterized protein n=1 Tax=Fusarium albosuccineum TaxID=1237068 RepID=A0A8H4L3E6_9HYPO|nr:hypothetical protein FALBO_12238 [Fusarium albosuccineum]
MKNGRIHSPAGWGRGGDDWGGVADILLTRGGFADPWLLMEPAFWVLVLVLGPELDPALVRRYLRLPTESTVAADLRATIYIWVATDYLRECGDPSHASVGYAAPSSAGQRARRSRGAHAGGAMAFGSERGIPLTLAPNARKHAAECDSAACSCRRGASPRVEALPRPRRRETAIDAALGSLLHMDPARGSTANPLTTPFLTQEHSQKGQRKKLISNPSSIQARQSLTAYSLIVGGLCPG